MSAKHTILVEFDGDQPGYCKGMKVLGGEVVAVQFSDALAENERLIEQRDELLASLIEMRDLFDLMCGLGFNPADGHEGSPKANADAAIAKATEEQA